MAISWNPALNDLITLLADLYRDIDEAEFVVRKMGLDPININFNGTPKVIWMRIVGEANKRGKVCDLIDVAKQDFQNIAFDALKEQLSQSIAPAIPTLSWKWKGPVSAVGGLEKVIGAQPTFLPINFLEIGLLRARSVAWVGGPSGVGTGFLTQNDLLITNHHVITTEEDAERTTVRFNYQKTAAGASAQAVEYKLDPALGFATDAADDWTAVRVMCNPSAEWGTLDLADATIKVDDYVNIIQHPGGLEKQIALYHNVVVFADDHRVQYLTDTRGGSSGSPVFDSEWRVIALHHSGGWLPEPGTDKVYFRNEGIHIRTLLNGLKECGLLNS